MKNVPDTDWLDLGTEHVRFRRGRRLRAVPVPIRIDADGKPTLYAYATYIDGDVLVGEHRALKAAKHALDREIDELIQEGLA